MHVQLAKYKVFFFGLPVYTYIVSLHCILVFCDFSLLYIETADRPGLLLEIIKIMDDINIHVESAEIETEVGSPTPSISFITSCVHSQVRHFKHKRMIHLCPGFGSKRQVSCQLQGSSSELFHVPGIEVYQSSPNTLLLPFIVSFILLFVLLLPRSSLTCNKSPGAH